MIGWTLVYRSPPQFETQNPTARELTTHVSRFKTKQKTKSLKLEEKASENILPIFIQKKHMGQFPEDGENGCFVSFFFKK